jgi:PAS domain S-box-containing protein
MHIDGSLFSSGPFMPHGGCYLWTQSLIALHTASDALIVLAYYSIPLTLIYFVLQRKDLKFHWMFVCFAVFILACGTTHLLEIWNIWHANYWLSGLVKAITALASVPTAVLLVKLVPDLLRLPSPAALEKEIAERQRAETAVRRLNDDLEQRVRERTEQLAATSKEWENEMARRWQTELALTRSQQLLQVISDNSPAVIYVKDLQGRYLLANRRYQELFQVSGQTLVGRTDHELFPRETADAFIALDQRVMDANEALMAEEVMPHDDGPHTYLSVKCPLRNEEGTPCGVFGISTDITERKRFEQQLKASLEEIGCLEAALDEHAIVAITDPQGKITHVNDKFCAISRYSREELLGQDHRLINSGHHPKEFIRDLWHTIAQGRVWHGEIKNKAKDGSFYWVDTTIVPFLNPDGKPRQYVAIRADITERKQAEADIRQLNAELEQRVARRTAELEAANRELEAFTYSISHDLRAPLRAVNGFAGIVVEDFGSHLPEAGRHHLERVRKGAQQMGELIDDLLSFSRLSRQSVNRHKVNTAKLVQETLDELAPQRQDRPIEIRVGEFPPCQGDPGLLKQVWINLVSNAIKYTRGRNPAIIEIGCTGNNGAIVYFVRDNGTGFDMQYADKLFGVFQRLHRADEFEGTGVGLAIVQRIVSRHGGRAWAEAAVDRGATFSFTLEGEPRA